VVSRRYTPMTTPMSARSLGRMEGRVISTITRVRYVSPDGSVSDTGPMELRLSDGSSAVFDVGPDGETLRVDEGPWQDPFQEPLSPDNRAYVQEVGKWTAFDVTDEYPYSALTGQRLEAVAAQENSLGYPERVSFRTQAATVSVAVGADELVVKVEVT